MERETIMYKLDHIVHFVDKPEQLVEETKKIGLHTVEGGKHEIWGTYNSLCYFGLSYIEFIGIFDKELVEKSALVPYTLHASYIKRNRQNGFTRLAIRTNEIEKDAEKFRAAGLEVYGPETFSRTRPDGTVLTWKLLHFGKKNLPLDYPFFIQWEGADEERYSELEKSGTIAEHPLGNLKVEEISYAVEDLSVAKEWAQLFDFEFEEGDSFIKLNASNCIFGFYQNQKEKQQNEIFEVTISGANEEKVVVIEKAYYKFIK